jgi:hypothetical protein
MKQFNLGHHGGSAGSGHGSTGANQPTQQSYIDFSFFSPTEGMDEETCNIFNEHFNKMRSQFESKLSTLNAIN